MKRFLVIHMDRSWGKSLGIALFVIGLFGLISAFQPGMAGAGIERVGLADGVGFERQLRLIGNVVCAECSLEEMREVLVRRGPLDLYELRDGQRQIVIEAYWVSHGRLRQAPPYRLRIRGTQTPLSLLAAEKNWFRNIEITGLLSHYNVLDIYEVSIQ